MCVAGAFQRVAAWERLCTRKLVITLDYCVAGVSQVCCRCVAGALRVCCRCVAGMMQVCCSVLQCVAHSVLHCAAVKCNA